jgi:malonate transporter
MFFSNTVLSIAPIFLLIVLGYLLRRNIFQNMDFWNTTDKLVYWVLFPALLYFKTATISLSSDIIISYAIVIYSGFGAAVLSAIIIWRTFKLNRPVASSVLQGSARHNAFIALAVAERLFGSEGLSLAALVTALLIPITNIVVVSLMVMIVQSDKKQGIVKSILRDLVRNPLLISVLLGIGMNLSGVTPILVVNELTGVLGQAALPIMLLGIGANIRVRRMGPVGWPTFYATLGKMVVFPAVMAIVAWATGLPQLATMVAAIFGAVPTAVSSFTLARQMGGDSQLMSSIITIQTILSVLSVPITLTLVQQLLF